MSESGALLEGRVGVVVGVSGENSIGFHAARSLHAFGAEVGITHRAARSDSCVALADAAGLRHAVLELDDETSIGSALTELAAPDGRIDFVVHTLVHVPEGVLQKRLVDVSPDDFHRVIEVGARSLVTIAKYAERHLALSPSPRLVTVGSICGERMTPAYHVAGIAKAALHATAMYLAHELGPKGILVNVVSPSLLATDGATRAVGADAANTTRALLARRSPLRRAADFDDLSRTIAYFCSELSSGVTAANVAVDGGYSKLYF